MTAQEYLTQLQNINAAINQDIHRLEEMRSRATFGSAIQYDRDRVQTSPHDTMSDAVISIVDMDARINQKIDRYAEAKEQIIDQIRGLHDALYTQILYDVYVMGLTLRQTALEIDRSYNNILHHHKKALDAFEKEYAPFSYLV